MQCRTVLLKRRRQTVPRSWCSVWKCSESVNAEYTLSTCRALQYGTFYMYPLLDTCRKKSIFDPGYRRHVECSVHIGATYGILHVEWQCGRALSCQSACKRGTAMCYVGWLIILFRISMMRTSQMMPASLHGPRWKVIISVHARQANQQIMSNCHATTICYRDNINQRRSVCNDGNVAPMKPNRSPLGRNNTVAYILPNHTLT